MHTATPKPSVERTRNGMADLDELLQQVVDQATFFVFVDALASDFAAESRIHAVTPSNPYGPGALGWENGGIDAFLDAAHAWGTETTGHPVHDAASFSPWRRFAEILYAGKYYE